MHSKAKYGVLCLQWRLRQEDGLGKAAADQSRQRGKRTSMHLISKHFIVSFN